MATKVDTRLLDDLHAEDGEEVLAHETVEFGLDGKTYEIDLTKDNSDELHELMERYIRAGHIVRPSTATVKRTKTGKNRTDRDQSQRIREWARKQGGEFGDVSDRGRIPAQILTAYYAAFPDEARVG